MLLRISFCAILIVYINLASSRKSTEDPITGTGSVISSFLHTIAANDKTPQCPGRCFNALAALACREVYDEPGLCSKAGFRCCKNLVENGSEGQVNGATATEKQTDEANVTVRTKSPQKVDDISEKKMDIDEDEPQLYSSAQSVEVCPGVCVAQRISNFCEAVIDVQGLCKTQLRCCVPAKLFDGVDIPPKEFKVINSPDGNNTVEESRSDMTDTPKLEIPATTPTTTTTRKATTEKKMVTELTSMTRDEMMSDDGIPPEKRCKGTCVAGFFAFLCDSIDRSGECAGGGKCCVTQRKPKPVKTDKNEVSMDEPADHSPPRRTTSKPKRQTTTITDMPKPSTTTKATTIYLKTTVDPPPPPCPGICLPVDIASRCQHPSKLVASSGCASDEICCEEKAKNPPAPPPKSPVSQVPDAFGSLLSLFGGSQSEKRPPPPPRTSTIPTTTTTTTTPAPTTAVTERPECTGTCISPILSFTCFGNAEMSDLFKCSKEKQSCCATKSAIRDLTRQQEMSNTARNDTVFPFEDPYYHLPSTVVRPPYSYLPEDDYQNSYYNVPSQEHTPYKPLPPYQPTIFKQQTFEKQSGGNEHQPFNPYGQSSHVPPPQPLPPPISKPSQPNQYGQPSQPNQYGQPSQPNQYGKPPHSHPKPPPPPPHVSQLQPHYDHEDSDVRQPYTPTHPAIPKDTAQSSSAQVPFLGESHHVDNKYVCGVKGTNRVARVVGGEDAIPGEWCWQVALINSLNQYLCGGAIIGTQWVLTAAHCVTNIVRSGDAIYVRVGDHDLTTRFGSPGAQTLPVATTYIHHNHNSQTLDNDIALLKLSSHAELGNGVCLACLPARGVSQVAGKRCTVTGYGYMGETGPIPLRVREAEIPVVSDNECVRKINAVTEKIFILPASSFCAGGESGHDACQGDGGGPLVCNVEGYYELSGLVSWGFGCGRQDVPGVYVKVSSFIGWVNQIISVNNL